ncbi:MAG: DUF222 domain-containing protein [Actinomycetota bacterium]|nr:DUF222 domain-containing protein [Actinomycetota bacterium]
MDIGGNRTPADSSRCSSTDLGRSLIAARRRLDAAEAVWLRELAEFDRCGQFALDGHLSTVAWLIDRCGMCRSTAKERLRVARELVRRPRVATAMAAGEVSYSKVRAITRIVGADAETDEVLLHAAGVGTAADLDRVASHWEQLRDQDLPPDVAWERRGVRHLRGADGLSTIEIRLPVEDAERFLAVLDLFIEHLAKRASAAAEGGEEASAEAPVVAACGEPDAERPGTAPAEASPGNSPYAEPVESPDAGTSEAAACDAEPITDGAEEASAEALEGPGCPTWSQRRADAVADLVELVVGRFDDEDIDTERAQVDVIVEYETLVGELGGTAEVAPGRAVHGETARRLACDAGLTRIITKGRSEVLDVGRRSRHWNRAQRRAIRYRYGHRCAIRGCEHTILQIHHLDWWEHGGHTDLNLGVPLCRGHHRLVHEGGWDVTLTDDRTAATLTRPQPGARWRHAGPNGTARRRLLRRSVRNLTSRA